MSRPPLQILPFRVDPQVPESLFESQNTTNAKIFLDQLPQIPIEDKQQILPQVVKEALKSKVNRSWAYRANMALTVCTQELQEDNRANFRDFQIRAQQQIMEGDLLEDEYVQAASLQWSALAALLVDGFDTVEAKSLVFDNSGHAVSILNPTRYPKCVQQLQLEDAQLHGFQDGVCRRNAPVETMLSISCGPSHEDQQTDPAARRLYRETLDQSSQNLLGGLSKKHRKSS